MGVPRLYFDTDQRIQLALHQWVSNILGYPVGDFLPNGRVYSLAMGIVDGEETIAAVVFHDYQPNVPSIQVSIASKDPRWCTRKILMQLFSYPFTQLGVRRLWAVTTKYNTRARRIMERLGFKFESKANMALPGGKNGYVYWMPKKECNWIDGKKRIVHPAPGPEPGGRSGRANRQQH